MKLTACLLAMTLLGLALDGAAEQTPGPSGSDDRVAIGGSVLQTLPVSGDLMGLGGDVDVAAPVAGDAFLAGGNVRIRDRIARDLHAGGGNVSIEGEIGRNVRVAGGNVDINSSARIGGKLSVAGGTVRVQGPVAGSIEVAAGDVLIDAPVGGDVRLAAGSVVLGPNARIAGKLIHHGWTEVKRDPAAQVAGGVQLNDRSERSARSLRWSRGLTHGWGWNLGLVVLAAILAGAFPAVATRLGLTLRAKPGLALLIGFVVLACVPIAALILGITIIGIPVAILLVLAYVALVLVGYATAGVLIGDAALARLRSAEASRTAWRVGAAALAALVLAVLGHVPVVGWIFGMAAIVAGIGVIAVALHDRRSGTVAA